MKIALLKDMRTSYDNLYEFCEKMRSTGHDVQSGSSTDYEKVLGDRKYDLIILAIDSARGRNHIIKHVRDVLHINTSTDIVCLYPDMPLYGRVHKMNTLELISKRFGL
jgi:hypothetical protein